MSLDKTAVILMNVGTPDSPSNEDVGKYLTEFLTDPRVINIPWLWRQILVKGFIVPFRTSKSAERYQLLWTQKGGSPLIYHTESLKKKLETHLDSNYKLFVAMRYGNPSLSSVLETVREQNFKSIIAVPLYPQFAESTTGTCIELIESEIKKFHQVPQLKIIRQFYDHPKFINAVAEKIKSYHPEQYDHILFSYHGLPNSHIEAIHPQIKFNQCTCDKKLPSHGQYCYKATCYATTRLIAKHLQLNENKYSQGFQSRFSRNWVTPFTDQLLLKLAREGVKKVLVVTPSFVTDCLETDIEIGVEHKMIFENSGGEKLTQVECLNDSDLWVEALRDIILKNQI